MPVAILDPAAGISGDMLLGALIDAGAPPSWLQTLPERLGYPDVDVVISRVSRAAVAAARVEFVIPGAGPHDTHAAGDHGHGHHVGALLDRIRAAPLSPWVRDHAVAAFEQLARAEARVHGTTPERVHLHEVGATDAVLDIVGAVEGFERLGVSEIYHLPVAVGSGWVRAAHGALPVPAPATAVLLEGLELRQDGPVMGEATTPTGAALLRTLSRGRPPARWRLTGSGWGAGTRDPKEYPNALRLLLGDVAAEAGVLDVIATDLDDLSPEYLEPVRAAVLAAGAVDCYAWALQGKKGRLSLRLEALTPADQADAVIAALLRHSTTAGIRRTTTTRVTLPRHEVVVEPVAGHRVRVKVWSGPDGPRWKAEYDDVAATASRLDRPAWEIAREAEALARPLVQEYNERYSRTEEQA